MAVILGHVLVCGDDLYLLATSSKRGEYCWMEMKERRTKTHFLSSI